MPRLAYVNGRYVPHRQASVHIEDRGFQFADGVYEVVAIVEGRLADFDGHMMRLARSLNELRIDWPMSRNAMLIAMHELLRRNAIRNGLLYIQITRGAAPRDFKFPKNTRPTIVLTARSVSRFATPEQIEQGVAVITIPDIRWLRRDIKSVALLPQVLGKQQAVEAGAFEAWQIDRDGMITEGCSSNAWIVTVDGALVTRHADNLILNGITRQSLIRLAKAAGIPVEIRPFSLAEVWTAREAFLSSASTFALPVTRIDGQSLGDGTPGPVTRRLRQAYLEFATWRGRDVTRPTTLPRAVLFDWDNTLVNSWACIHDALNVTLEAMGHPAWTLDESMARIRRSLRDSFPLLFGERWEEARSIYYSYFEAHHIDRLRPLDGAAEVLQALHQRGIYLAVVSNKTGRFLRREAAALDWERYFSRLIGAADASADKPAPEPVVLALEPAGYVPGGFSAAQAWFVGDADIDMECAHAAGCLPVLVGGGVDAASGRFPPALNLPDCRALASLIEALEPAPKPT